MGWCARLVHLQRYLLVRRMICHQCNDCGWVCEEHPGRPWQVQHACPCGAAGMPCPNCNVPTDGKRPRMPEGFETDAAKDGWRH
jgi:hypothetical protein